MSKRTQREDSTKRSESAVGKRQAVGTLELRTSCERVATTPAQGSAQLETNEKRRDRFRN